MKTLNGLRGKIGDLFGSPGATRPAPPAAQPPAGPLGARGVQADPAGVGSHRRPPGGAALAPQIRTPHPVVAANPAWAAQPSAAAKGLVGTTLNRAAQRLGPSTIHASHPIHGDLTITRALPTPDHPNQFNFSLQLNSRTKAEPENATAHAGIEPADSSNQGMPSLGYGEINIEPLNRAGIGSLLHAHMAKTGMELGVDTFVIDTVSSSAMHGFCQKMGMQPSLVTDGTEWVPMQQLYDRARRSAEEKGWTFDPNLAS